MLLRLKKITCVSANMPVGRKIFFFVFNFSLLEKDKRKCLLGLNIINST